MCAYVISTASTPGAVFFLLYVYRPYVVRSDFIFRYITSRKTFNDETQT